MAATMTQTVTSSGWPLRRPAHPFYSFSTPIASSVKVYHLADQTRSPLFTLPAELRNKIYFYLLTTTHQRLEDDRRERARGWRSSYVLPGLDIHPNILATCKQARDEATDILYTNHVFGAHQSLLTQCPYLLDPSRPIYQKAAADKIGRWWICLRLDIEPRFDEEKVTKAFTGMDELCIEVWEAQYASCDYTVLKLFANVRAVKKAYVTGSVERKFARWLERAMMSPVGRNVPAYWDDSNLLKIGYDTYDEWTHGGR
ncbi:hypothetical protein EJ05DRAFT_471701 [Pseudovirgaria hyperparasitica]|uniref:F-box domain-containing protein n=1 Tax=Pseudovirgaria hyperparasitica TaxID=470096 RepID=A0A6A6WKR1_9PEZI|nr:uncharacterized protein EJ05DRAFT_471701 [Pseudovirgaria hyperparasitica]KAF2762751.1 hypothetical protein EJ05DRAFT_471701 [Pseudovirgaria hyperparasitica]